MAAGDLFHGFSLRFSFKKDQHVRMLEKFEDRELNGGKSKNQVIMDALEMYYDNLENNGNTTKEVTEKYLEKRLEWLKQEVLWDILRILIGGNVAGRSLVLAESSREQETNFAESEEDADISKMPDIMSKVMDWSNN